MLPGGLTRVALREGSLVVNSSAGRRLQGHLGAHLPARPVVQRRTVPLDLVPAALPADAPDPGPAHRAGPAATAGGGRRGRVLSRAAEALFWIGRYAERAEDTARLLDVHFHQIVVDPAVDEVETCRVVATVMGLHDRAPETARGVLDLLAFDADNASSIVGSLSPPPGRTPAACGRPCPARSGSA